MSDRPDYEAKYREIEARYKDALFQLKSIKDPSSHSIAGLDQFVIQTDDNLKITYINTPMARLLESTKEELKGRALQEIDHFPWGPGYMEVLANHCRTMGHEVIKDRSYFDKANWRDTVNKAITTTLGDFNSYNTIITEFDSVIRKVRMCYVTLLKGKNGYRLPFPDEFEYALRGGTTAPYLWGNNDSAVDEFAWWYGNSNNMTHGVGLKKMNAFGLYDIIGNINEWCWDTEDGISRER